MIPKSRDRLQSPILKSRVSTIGAVGLSRQVGTEWEDCLLFSMHSLSIPRRVPD